MHDKLLRKIAALSAAMVFALALISTPALASTRTISARDLGLNGLVKNAKKATSVKTGTVRVKTGKKGRGTLKLKATKTKTYKITISDVKGAKANDTAFVEMFIAMIDGNKNIVFVNSKTSNGRRAALLAANKRFLRTGARSTVIDGHTYKFRTTCTATIKLYKGETLYLDLGTITGKKQGPASFKLTIK